jgi:hypothetical protein
VREEGEIYSGADDDEVSARSLEPDLAARSGAA